MPSLRLALRALWFRRGLSAAILLVAMVTTTVAATGPFYARAAGESILRDRLLTAAPEAVGLRLQEVTRVDDDPLGRINQDAARAGLPIGYPSRIPGYQLSATFVALRSGSSPDVDSRLTYREGVCAHLVLVAGRCPSGAGEAAVSDRTSTGLRWRVGTRLQSDKLEVDALNPQFSDRAPKAVLAVVGVYRPRSETERYWFGQDFFDAHPAKFDEPNTVDSIFVDRSTFESLHGVIGRAVLDLPLDPAGVRLANEVTLRTEVAHLLGWLRQHDEGVELLTSLPATLDAVAHDRQLLGVSTLLVTLQLALLAWLVLHLIVASASEVRGSEVALAKLRGHGPFSTIRFGLLEPVLLLCIAVPFGIVLADLAVRVLSRLVLVPGTPVVLRLPPVLAAVAALAGGIVAAALAARRTLTRPILEQWRRTGHEEVRGLTIIDGVVAALAVAGLAELHFGGALREGRTDNMALLAPGLLTLAVGLLGVRLVPLLGRSFLPSTRASSRIGTFLALRQVVRRPAGLRLAVLLAVAIGLATFAVDGVTVAATNRAQRAATDVGAATVATVRIQAGQDVRALVRRTDPTGRWAMAVARIVPPGESFNGELLAIDTPRFAAIAHWRDDFAGLPLSDLMDRLGAPAPPVITLQGQAVRLTVRTRKLPHTPFTVRLDLADGAGQPVSAPLGRLVAGRHTYSGDLPRCASPCRLDRIVLDRMLGDHSDVTGDIEISGLSLRTDGSWMTVPVDWTDLSSWHPPPTNNQSTATLTAAPGVLRYRFVAKGGDPPTVVRGLTPLPLPIALDPGAASNPKLAITASDIDQVPVDVVTASPVVPSIGSGGGLVDLGYARALSSTFDDYATYSVWLSQNAPRDAVQRLERAGLDIVDTRTTAERRRELDRTGPALGLLLFGFSAAAGAVLATGVTAVAIYVTGRQRSYELAAMLAVGTPRRDLLRSCVGEQLIVVGSGLVLGVGAGLVAAWLALPAIPEFPDAGGSPPLQFTPHVLALGAFLLFLAGVVTLTASVAARLLLRSARPVRLRETAQ